VLTHYVGLRADSNQAVDVLADGHQHLAGHVAALLGARGLVFNMDASSTLLDKELGQLHDSRQTAVASIGIGNDGAEVINVGELCALVLGHRQAFLPLLAVVEELSHEQVANLVRDGGLFLPVNLDCWIRL
jgi:hypothetical protein